MSTLSEDGYVRLLFEELQELRLHHLSSALDDNMALHVCGGASKTMVTGYTEWVSDSPPVITIGWDWELDTIRNQVRFLRVGPPRSNVMLTSANLMDLGRQESTALQAVFVDSLDWQTVVQDRISIRYG